MANRNGQGPEGKGSMTGRGMGNCSNTATESNDSFVRGAGRGAGQPGRGMGRTQGAGQGRGRNRR
ncbi:DUF5320 family protein [Clostridiaceae bacterium HSG29]|nr:DUF5320 family protein [Clostridiaceae bacterium HSG29]